MIIWIKKEVGCKKKKTGEIGLTAAAGLREFED
jgi:hypothetical protein